VPRMLSTPGLAPGLSQNHESESEPAGGRLTTAPTNGIVCAAMNELRELRRAVSFGQREFAALLSIPLETFRPWDSGRRVVPVAGASHFLIRLTPRCPNYSAELPADGNQSL
jgi:DNA-binding transcriptional regulator YiaG